MKIRLLLLCVLVLACTACVAEWTPQTQSSGEHHVVATVDYDEMYWDKGINYTRVIELQHSGADNGTLVATYELYTSGLHVAKPGYNIHVSRDGGNTWELVSTVREKAAAIQSEYQPFLYELPSQVGDMPAGTLLLAGCSIDSGHGKQTALRLYRSYDVGQTWEQFGTVAIGGGLDVNGKPETGVWEPFLMMLPDGRLACYYADCTDEANHSQKVVMRITEDGVNWDEAIDIIALEKQTMRPGMPVVTRMNDGRFIMAYEIVEYGNPDYGCPVHVRFSADGINWGDPTDPGTKVVTNQKAVPGSSPYLAYLSNVGENGLLLLTSGHQQPGGKPNVVYYNANLGDAKAWRSWEQPVEYAAEYGYSHAIFADEDGRTAYFVNSIPDAASELGYYKMIFLSITFDN